MIDLRPAPPHGRRALRVLFAAQAVAAVGLAAGGTAGGLLAEHVAGTAAVGALPLGLLVVGSGLSAPPVSALMRRRGRRAGLVAALTVAVAGTVAVLVGAATLSLTLILAGSLLLGAGNAAVMLARYAAADLGPPERLGRSLSAAMFAITLGAVLGPNLLGPAGWLAHTFGLPDAAGLYLVALGAFAIATALLLFALSSSHTTTTLSETPDGRDHAGGYSSGTGASTSADHDVRRAPRVVRRVPRLPLAILAGANLTMVTVMAVAPVHLHSHGWSLEAIGLVISLHIAAMFAPSPLSGWARDRIGSLALAALGAAAFVATGVSGAFLGMTGTWTSICLLLLLGFGWNAQLVSGSALLAESTSVSDRHRAEGLGEFGMGLAAAAGTLLAAGPLVAVGGIRLLSVGAAAANLIMIGVFFALRLRGHRGCNSRPLHILSARSSTDDIDDRRPELKRSEAG